MDDLLRDEEEDEPLFYEEGHGGGRPPEGYDSEEFDDDIDEKFVSNTSKNQVALKNMMVEELLQFETNE